LSSIAPLRLVLVLAAALVAALSLAPAGSAQAYPSPPFDFGHQASPHDPIYSFAGGLTDRPMLVIYARWDDVDYPPAFPASRVAGRFFGPFPSVADYFSMNSFGGLTLTQAAETEGTANDGVVQVHVPGTKADFFMLSPSARNKILVQAADPFVDYASFDADGNGAVSRLELLLNTLEADPLPVGQGLGIARGIDAVSVDGKTMSGQVVAMDGTHTSLITIIHENGHAALNMDDLYRFAIGKFDLAGPGGFDDEFYGFTAWQKMHLGWIAPQVVERDGYYDVRRADATGDAFILYDPDRGTDDYFIVENRKRTPGTYDEDVADQGLVIWRVDETNYRNPDNNLRPIELMRPDGTATPIPGDGYGGSAKDAWNPADFLTPERTMTRTWRDGTDSRVAVRAIDRAGETIRAYLDVRGPGVLADPYLVDLNGAVQVVADEPTALSVPVMNTGEETDTFTFDLADLPLGWTTTSSTQTLAAEAESVALLQLTPAPNAPLGVYTVSVRGTSTTDPSVTSSASFLVEVIDVTPPELEVTLSPDSLWPPNHKLVTVAATVTVTDDYDPSPAVELVSVTSSEPDNGPGDGNTTGDIAGADVGTDDRSFQLRAERSGAGSGRTYTVVYKATDASGNVATASATVFVPKSRHR